MRIPCGYIMADKVKEFAGRMGNAPRGVSLGIKLLAGAAAIGYAIKESLYTGERVFRTFFLQ